MDAVFEKLLDWLGGSVVALLLGAVVVRVRDLWRKHRSRPSGDRGERVTVWDAYPTDTGLPLVVRSIRTRAAEPFPDVSGPLWILKSGPADPLPANPAPAGLLAAMDEAAYTDPHFPKHQDYRNGTQHPPRSRKMQPWHAQPLYKPMEQLEIGGDDGQVRRCLRPWVPTASVQERRESGAMYASPPKRYAEPVKRRSEPAGDDRSAQMFVC